MEIVESCEFVVKFTVPNPKKLENRVGTYKINCLAPRQVRFYALVVVNLFLACNILIQHYEVCVSLRAPSEFCGKLL